MSRTAHFALLAAIVVLSALLGVWVDWRAPGLERYTRDWLMRARGPLAAPDNIALVAIDEPSIARFGRFPWPRSLSAQALDRLAAAQPKVIALDVLYTDPTNPSDDGALDQAIGHAGNVVVAAQLTGSAELGGPITWLLPIPAVGQAAASIGHVNVSTESDGVARQLLIRQADDSGRALRAMAVEAVRIGDGISDQAITETPSALLLGPRVIPTETPEPALLVAAGPGSKHAPEVQRASRMTIDYIGPAGSFAHHTYSFADVLDGRVPAQNFRGKYVLVGATAASLGDRLASPFVHQSDLVGNQHGSFMPGVEVLANAIHTILDSRFYADTPSWLAFLLAGALAALTLLLLALAQGSYEAAKQFAVLAGLAAGIVFVSYLAFTGFLVFPPVVPVLVAFTCAAVLGLLQRSLVTSAGLDASIAAMARASQEIAPLGVSDTTAESIALLAEAPGAAIFRSSASGRFQRVSAFGGATAPRLRRNKIVPGAGDGRYQLLTVPVAGGVFALMHATGKPLSPDVLMLYEAIAASSIAAAREESEITPSALVLPRGVEWKSRALGRLNGRILERSRFIDSALQSVDDGLLIARADGRVTFANRRAETILGPLLGRDLFERLASVEHSAAPADSLKRLLLDRATIEREICIRETHTRYYRLRLGAVSAGAGPVLGIVASLSDITRQHELQQTKSDVISLVSHEMRTPLTAIQGLSELLAQFDVEPARRKEMNLAINEEVKRLGRMIDEYLDITRLEAGASTPRFAPVRLQTVLERALLLLEPVAAQRRINLLRGVPPNLPVVLADSDLILRAVNNLVSNAIKYSPPGSDVTISAGAAAGRVSIVVADHGYGIPESDLERVFEKFYRVPRVQDADVAGTGLGLALVREIAELHHGTVTLSSTVGVGSTFTLSIPEELPKE